MMSKIVFFPSLYNALTLRERVAIQQANGKAPLLDPSAVALADKRLKRWQEQRPFANATLFEQRLAQDGLNTKTLEQILGRSGDDYAAATTTPPPWAEQLAQLFGDPGHPADGRPANKATAEGFLAAFAPLIAAARTRLRQELVELLARFAAPRLAAHPVSDIAALEAMLYDTVHHILKQMVTPTLVLELNIARLRGELTGETPEERFAAYTAQLSQPETVRPLVAEYPVLFRLAAERLDIWHNVSLELVERLGTDWEAIYATFAAGQQPAPLLRLAGAQGSTKRGGRSVIVFEFTTGLKVVYKPRSLALEKHFQELLLWLNQQGYALDFRPLTLLDYGTHGWVEWLEAAECAAEEEVQRFYQRQGAYLALLYALEATDFHLKNIIAAGEHPLLIDLEALFHPRDADPDWHPLDLALDGTIYHSVMRLGFLPEPELGEDETLAPVDLSGMGGVAGQLTPYASPTWEDRGTDTMRLVRKRRAIKGGKNLPVLDGRPAHAVDYHQAIDEGFTAMYRLLMQRREALLAPNGPLARFAADEVRVLPRSGKSYGALLDQSFHPDLLRDALERDRFLDQLWKDVEDEPHLAHLIPHEQADLLIGDTPLFTTHADSRTAYGSSGRPIPDFFPQSGLDAARQRMMAMDEEDLDRQRWFIQASLATVAEERERLETGDWRLETGDWRLEIGDWRLETGRLGDWETEGQGADDREETVNGQLGLLEEARGIGERLEVLAVQAVGEASWLGLELGGGRHWQIESLDIDLFNGLPGVALFLAHLGALTGEKRWTELARAAVTAFERYLVEEYEEDLDTLSPIGAFNGLGGQLYTLAHLAALWQDESLIQTAEAYVETAALFLQDVADDEEIGVADGIAGLLVGLLAVYQVAPTPRTLAVACQAGEQLLTCLEHDQNSAVFANPEFLFTDFWYGPSGIDLALLALAEARGNDRFRMVRENGTDRNPFVVAASAAALTGRPTKAAAEAGTTNHSLGYGAMGYLELLLQAAVALDDPDLHKLCDDYAAAVLADAQDNGWRCGTPLNVETPGLMTGLAGIGYTLLRLAAPERVPSVVRLEIGDWRLEIRD